MVAEFFGYFSFAFTWRLLIVGLLLAVCSALLGVCLVPKRYSMIGDGLSHVGFGALAVASALGAAPLAVAMPVVIIASFLLLRIKENGKIKGDSAIAMISSSALALGFMIVSLSGSNTDLEGYMFGSILAITKTDFITALIIFPIVIISFVVFYTQIFAVSYDESFARATGMKAGFYDMLLAVLVAVTVVIGMRIMGTLLISALVIFPSISAMRVCKSYFATNVCAVAVSALSFLVGMFSSFVFSTPIGASIVICNVISFFVLSVVGAILKRKG